MIAIIDYGVGNIKAFYNIFKRFNIPCKVANTNEALSSAEKIILPGVGSFDHAMVSLERSGMKEMLDELVLERRLPVLGVCVGMQMLARRSDEGSRPGLGWMPGDVKKFDKIKIQSKPLPHMGWNSLDIVKKSTLLAGLEPNPRFYFLHSFYFQCTHEDDVLATTNYGNHFASVVHRDNIYGIQCHPEKSHHNGMQFLKNFGRL